VGAHKAGTTWLARNLWRHPQVWRGFAKEMHHFAARNDDLRPHYAKRFRRQLRQAFKHARKGGNPARLRYLKTLRKRDDLFSDAWYQAVFSGCQPHQKTGEITPSYATLPDAGLDDIERSAPGAQIIFLVRDPADRARSALKMLLRRAAAADAGKTDAPPRSAEALAREWLDSPAAQARGDYAACIPRFDARWGEDRMLYLPYGWIRDDPLKVLRAVEKRLGLRPSEDWPDLRARVHAGGSEEPPAFALEEIERRASVQRAFLADRFGEDFAAQTA